jgi:hypothetical protein
MCQNATKNSQRRIDRHRHRPKEGDLRRNSLPPTVPPTLPVPEAQQEVVQEVVSEGVRDGAADNRLYGISGLMKPVT